MTIVFGLNLQVVLSLVSRIACPSIYLCFLDVFGLRRRHRFFKRQWGTNGRIGKVLVTIFISVFLSVVRVCLPRSPLLAVLWSSSVCFFFSFFGLSVCVFPLFAPPRSPSLAVLRFPRALSWLCLSVRVSFLASLLAPYGGAPSHFSGRFTL